MTIFIPTALFLLVVNLPAFSVIEEAIYPDSTFYSNAVRAACSRGFHWLSYVGTTPEPNRDQHVVSELGLCMYFLSLRISPRVENVLFKKVYMEK